MQTTVRKWGNSLGVRVPTAFAESVHIEDGTHIEMIVNADEQEIIIRRRRRSKKYTLEELLAQMPRQHEKLHGETDWGEPVGDELW